MAARVVSQRPGAASEFLVPLRITVLNPVPGVSLMLQRGKDAIEPPVGHSPTAVTFECSARVRPAGKGLRWLGEYVHGPVTDRFINCFTVGKRAAQPDSPWHGRAKVKLASITSAQVRDVLLKPGRVLGAGFDGVGRDGGPSCAAASLVGAGWRIVRAAT